MCIIINKKVRHLGMKFEVETKVFIKCCIDTKTIVCIEILRTFSQQLSFMLIFFFLHVNHVELVEPVEGLVEGSEGTLEHVRVCIGLQDPTELI